MTLNLSFACPAFVVQVGDRLVTTTSGSHTYEWEAASNKSILCVGDGFKIAVSYAGLAHLRGVPTDEWIVRQMTSLDETVRGTVMGGVPRLYLGPTMQRIQRGIHKEFYSLPQSERKHGLEIMVSGWTWGMRARRGSRRVRSYELIIKAPRNRTGFKTDLGTFPERRFYFSDPGSARSHTVSIGVRVGAGRLREQQQLFKARLVTPDLVEQLLVDQIRYVAALRDVRTVGLNCMAIRIPLSSAPEITYYRGQEEVHIDSQLSYSPWIIYGGNLISSPMRISGAGGPALVIGDEEIEMKSVPPIHRTSGIHWAGSYLRRPLSELIGIERQQFPLASRDPQGGHPFWKK